MNSYEALIGKFIYENAPTPDVAPSVQFEAVSSAVFGTKQRRQGPMPSPEDQVLIRDALREGDQATFLIPWASSKQANGAPLDVLEFCALVHLRQLAQELRAYQRQVRFVFRIEDATDRFLFGDGRLDQILTYRDTLQAIIPKVLGDFAHLSLVPESFLASHDEFRKQAELYVPVFYQFLTGKVPVESLWSIGWKGSIPRIQRDYYVDAFSKHYPGEDPDQHLAKYFAATLARVKLDATAKPSVPHVQISFAKPVPGSPVGGPRLYYRTLPARHTHHHQAPWMATGYLQIAEDSTVRPQFWNPAVPTIPCATRWGSVQLQTNYSLA